MRETLLLTDDEVKQILEMPRVLDAVEEAFREKGLGRVQMPPKVYIFYNKYEGDLRVMPSYLEGLDISAVKVVNVHPRNASMYGLPTVMAVVLLVDPKSGFPISIMSGSWLTAMRTGAAGGVAAKYLARKDSEVLAFVGAGTQAKTQLIALKHTLRNIKVINVYDVVESSSKSFANHAVELIDGATVNVCRTPREAVEGADIVVTTTPSRQPVVMSSWIKPGVHINCIGADAPGKEELDPEILVKAKVVVDDMEQAIHSGEVNVPIAKGVFRKEQIYGELGEIVAGLKRGRDSRDEITIFTSTGLAIQDAVTAWLTYNEARSRGLGKLIRLVC
ncbi:MAG: alanine dehydrogenase [Candidatus Nezhaarchaeota archaeon]|nr:alanine dehydrogenase [Candidatus Nezhaarchaeota archaeon]